MKNLTDPSPRFTCRLIRGWRSIAGGAQPGRETGLGSAHVAGCADCRQFFRACDELESSLRRDAVSSRASVPAGLDRRIMQAVAQARVAPRRRPISRPVFAFAAAAAGVALAMVYLPDQAVLISPSHQTDPAASPDMIAPDETVALAPESAPPAPAGALLKQDPLQKEAEAIYADARSALRFLERNFTPVAVEPTRGSS